MIAGGVESMSRVPMGTTVAAGGDPFGPLSQRYPDGLAHQGIGAELIAARWKLDREELDAFAAAPTSVPRPAPPGAPSPTRSSR